MTLTKCQLEALGLGDRDDINERHKQLLSERSEKAPARNVEGKPAIGDKYDRLRRINMSHGMDTHPYSSTQGADQGNAGKRVPETHR